MFNTLFLLFSAVSIDGFLYRAVHQQDTPGVVVVESELVNNHSCATVYEFLIGELHVYHTVSLYTSELDHHRSGDHIEDHLLSCARFHA